MGGIFILIAFYQDGDGYSRFDHPQSEIEDATHRKFHHKAQFKDMAHEGEIIRFAQNNNTVDPDFQLYSI